MLKNLIRLSADHSALSDDEIETMVKDAEAHANEDAQRKEAAEARNQADRCREILDVELGVEPSPALKEALRESPQAVRDRAAMQRAPG